MVNYSLFYIEANVVCVIILLMLLKSNYFGGKNSEHHIIFNSALLSIIAYFGVDIFYTLVDNGMIVKNQTTIYFTNVLLYSVGTIVAFVIMHFQEIFLGNYKMRLKHNIAIAFIPALINIVFLVTTPMTKLVVKYDSATNSIGLGYLYFVMLSIILVYVFIPFFHALGLMFKEKNRQRVQTIKSIVMFPLILGIAVCFQALLWEIPCVCFGLTLDILYLFLNHIQNILTMDSLTQLNNGFELKNYLNRNVEHNMSFLVVKLDDYKFYVDNGDMKNLEYILLAIADAIRKGCSNYKNVLMSRYRDDMFVACLVDGDYNNMYMIKDVVSRRINEELQAKNIDGDININEYCFEKYIEENFDLDKTLDEEG